VRCASVYQESVMDISSKLAILDQIYSIYDKFISTLDVACKKYCAHCCTINVTLTTLEGYKIIEGLMTRGKSDVLKKIQAASGEKGFQPKTTTNQLAALCAEGIEPPAEQAGEEGKKCPFLIENQCSIYKLRPFGCRCLISRHNCRQAGYAEVDDFVLSVNTVFLQTIENVDFHGCTGNLVHVLSRMMFKNNRRAYQEGAIQCSDLGLICNHPLRVLMIPPEHRTKIKPILQKLREIRVYFTR
jgi:Fe-S-cluster containining protein